VRPDRVGRFFSTWREMATISSARSRRVVISAVEIPSIPSKCRRLNGAGLNAGALSSALADVLLDCVIKGVA